MATSCYSQTKHSPLATLESTLFNRYVRTTFLTTWLKTNLMTCLVETQQTRLLFKLQIIQFYIIATHSFQSQTKTLKVTPMEIITIFSNNRLTLERFKANYLTKIVIRSKGCLRKVNWVVWAMKFNKVHYLPRTMNIHWICFQSRQIFTLWTTLINKISSKTIQTLRNNKLNLTAIMNGDFHKYIKIQSKIM